MKTEALILSSVLIMVPIIISYKEKLELNRDIIVSMLRAVVQLLAVGYVLDVIFGLDKLIYTVILVLVMIINAAINTKKKGFTIESQVFISFVSISVGTIITLGILISSKAIGYTPNEVIPVAGMIISNSMVAIGLSYRNLINNFKNNSIAVEVKLSLGASIKEASDEIIRESIKISIMPTIDSAKTLGIVSLPGMMTGLILAGASPLVAVKFQIMVTFMILSSSSIATIMATYLSYKKFFNKRKQLKQIVV
ncbi:MAG: iron export ABC transporter permease subunit FetB [Terrisporobacter othiniensis]|uniref:ABC transporter permease n=1 Tax=Terrisporobacter petrolearius TaxID=1460447 RepID=UPI0008EBABEB|nr:iron export ABC transporter permease subunit FetB [Terrisporobacter petrolearius]MDU4862356.1 iron export ABC transporter permease subunit FetB [Terrisporobacter othiniensis]MDU6996181.1 iron export ABC transporter permease subunit FetB [Terrisporobacter othiniensis]SFJ69180.1 putative ABC transport system permease protein [Terrisporobacter glycolicus]